MKDDGGEILLYHIDNPYIDGMLLGHVALRVGDQTCRFASMADYSIWLADGGCCYRFDLSGKLLEVSLLFAAIYKVLPDRNLEWGDVVIGAIVTGVLFTVGKSLISLYIGSSAVASSFVAAGALIVLLLWVYYSAQIFLLGAEFTKVYANRHGSKQDGKPRRLKRAAREGGNARF